MSTAQRRHDDVCSSEQRCDGCSVRCEDSRMSPTLPIPMCDFMCVASADCCVLRLLRCTLTGWWTAAVPAGHSTLDSYTSAHCIPSSTHRPHRCNDTTSLLFT